MSALDSVRAVSDNGSALQKLTAGAQSALPVIKTSPFSCELVVGAINGLGKLLLDGNSIGGLSVNTGNILTDRVMLSLAQVFTTTTVESLSDNMKTLFGVDMSIPQDQHKPTAETSNTTAETGSGNSDTPVSPDKPTETTPVDEQTGAIEYIMNVDLGSLCR